MTYRQIETSREIRLWIKEIIVPSVIVGAGLLSIPEVRKPLVKKYGEVKESIKKKFKKD